ncbi:MAG: DUF934 domain-containing protein [Methylomonas sp.]|nr:DUF934 domain-containing protein [Methylomonas sp.]
MPIIKDQQITENTWTFVADDSPLVDGDITVTLRRWNEDKQQLASHNGKIGIRLTPSDPSDAVGATDLSGISLIELDFPAFTDGRLFSHAQLLRSRNDYQGEIRAVGNFISDQVFYLHRVGVDAFEFSKTKDLELALAALNDFSVSYQASIR